MPPFAPTLTGPMSLLSWVSCPSSPGPPLLGLMPLLSWVSCPFSPGSHTPPLLCLMPPPLMGLVPLLSHRPPTLPFSHMGLLPCSSFTWAFCPHMGLLPCPQFTWASCLALVSRGPPALLSCVASSPSLTCCLQPFSHVGLLPFSCGPPALLSPGPPALFSPRPVHCMKALFCFLPSPLCNSHLTLLPAAA